MNIKTTQENYDILMSVPGGRIKGKVTTSSITTKNRLNKIRAFFGANPGATAEYVVCFMPETDYMVSKYLKSIRSLGANV